MNMAFLSLIFEVSSEWGENIQNWVKKEAFALALVAVIIIIIPMIISKAWAKLFTALIAAGIGLYFVGNPEKLRDIGETIFKIVFGG